MIVAESLTKAIDFGGEKLDFEVNVEIWLSFFWSWILTVKVRLQQAYQY
jgi:hypothetical protein